MASQAWNGPIKTADELAEESVGEILGDMPLEEGAEVALLINGLGRPRLRSSTSSTTRSASSLTRRA